MTLNLLRDWVIACCGSRIKTFPKMEKLWTEIPVLFNYLLLTEEEKECKEIKKEDKFLKSTVNTLD